jgi:hypothetical protein
VTCGSEDTVSWLLMRLLWFTCWLGFVVGCPPVDSGSDTSQDTSVTGTDHSEVEPDSSVDPGTDPEPTDLDQDGAFVPDDCDDREPEVFPGAEEVWDGQDNDCDGHVDGQGTFSGQHTLMATAIVEGQTRRTTVVCDVVLTRATVVIGYTIDCDVASDDDLAIQLLGESLSITPEDNVAIDGEWDGLTSVQSVAPWQATGSGTASWSDDMTELVLTSSLQSSSLRLSGSGVLVREE